MPMATELDNYGSFVGMKGENTDTVKSWESTNCNKNEKEGTLAVHQISKTKKLNGHRYKEMLKSLARKAKGSDLSIQERDKLSPSEVNAIEASGSNEDEPTTADSSISHAQPEKEDFLLRQVRFSDHEERSNGLNRADQTKEKNDDISEGQCDLDMSKLQSKLAHGVSSECNSTTTNFVEYWVPVRLSNVQVELYCGSLFSNATLLCSSVKHDPTEMLQDILVSTRKCCDHPYLVDWSLHTSLIQGIPEPEQLDAEIKLSNKLLLLYKILLEIKKRRLRLLILYQSLGGSGSISTGDILDDIIHVKFGEDSFIRIGGGISPYKKRAALNTFNDTRSGTFVCLMETRACLSSIKLASVDTVIFFNSDWDPMNDLRALQKIKLDSRFEQVKVFRFYSPHTVEEKVLILTKQGMTPEGNIINIKRSTCHGLLTWGASHLFEKLDEFHSSSASDTQSIVSYGDSFVEDVFLQLSSLLPNNGKNNVYKNNSFILEVRQIGDIYPRNITLLGEVESPLIDNFSLIEEMITKEPAYVFWMNILEGRNPRWKFFSSRSTRIRKSVRRFDDWLEESAGPDSASKKCRKEARRTFDQIPTIIRRRTRNKLPSRDKRRKLSELDRQEKATSWIKQKSIAVALPRVETPMLGGSSTEHAALPRVETPMLGGSSTEHAALSPVETPMLGGSSTEHYSLLPPNEHDHVSSSTTAPNAQAHGTTGPSFHTPVATHPLVEDSIRPMESSVQHSAGAVPLQTCQPPEASQVTHSETLQSICKALQIELERLQKERAEILRLHEDMILQTKMACKKEIDQIHKKCDVMLQNAEKAFVEEKKVLETKYNKVYLNKSLAETMMQAENSKSATLSQVTTNCSIEEVNQLMFQSPEPITVAIAEQAAENLPILGVPSSSVVQELNQASNSARIASTSNESCETPCVTDPNPVTLSEVASCQLAVDVKPAIAETILAPRKASARQGTKGMTGISKNSTSIVQVPEAPPGFSRPLSLMPNRPINFSRNIQPGYEIRAPAPHFRQGRHPMSIAEPRLSSPRPGIIFSPVSLQKVACNVQTRQSQGLTSSSSLSSAGMPHFGH